MPYRFEPDEMFAAGFRRIGLEQIERARTSLTAPQAQHSHIHDARKSFKRLRALLRLVRPALPPKLYRRENRRFRDLARLLASSRERYVLRETVVKLEIWLAGNEMPAMDSLRDAVCMNGGETDFAGSAKAMNQAADELTSARQDWNILTLPADDFECLGKGLEKSYNAGYHSFAAAYASGRDEDFHEWRKYVQQHWRHMQLLQNAWPDYFAARIRETKALSELLGDDHDLFILSGFVDGLRKKKMPSKKASALADLLSLRQQQLRTIARARGDRLYVEGAKGLHHRIRRYWETGVRITRAENTASALPKGDQ